MGRISVIGMGPGGPKYMLPAAAERIEAAGLIVGSPKQTEAYLESGKELMPVRSNWKEVSRIIARRSADTDIAVLVSGDPTLYSFTAMLRRSAPEADMEIIPGISSFQYLTASLGLQWNDAAVVSFHGEKTGTDTEVPVETGRRLLDLCKILSKIIVFTDPNSNPGAIARFLLRNGQSSWNAAVGCNLGGEDERIMTLPLAELGENWKDTEQLCIMILIKEE